MSSIGPTGKLRVRNMVPGRTPAASQHEPPFAGAQAATSAGPEEAAEAFLTSLYAQYWTKLQAYVRRMISDPHLAEEIVQETMLRAWRNADVLSQQTGSVWGWLSKVARNIVVDHIRRKAARPAEVEDAVAGPRCGLTADHSDDVIDSVDVAAVMAGSARRTVPCCASCISLTGPAPRRPGCWACRSAPSSPGCSMPCGNCGMIWSSKGWSRHGRIKPGRGPPAGSGDPPNLLP